ncbi:helix-turn-helix domain-containing protein [Anaeromassilibacillus senegalensis]|uniref:helix-turn-helix domain-containing protein n=1 Tax=Anaeromassilibacillus senegalensis TaxID=1673717 RepID=UPI000680275C|nr:helix-turn-helix transcriptional regulator [Anaeromassilibacillus senegalensis]
MDNINSRFRALFSDIGISQSDFARRLSITPAYIWKLLNKSDAVPSDRTIADICREFDVNEDWLRTGDGDMYIKKLPTDEVAEYVAELLDNDDSNPFYTMIIDMMRTYHKLDDKSKAVVKDFFKKLREGAQKKEGD